MAKKNTVKKETKPKLKTIKLGIELNNTVVHNREVYNKLPNGNYINSKTKEEIIFS